MSQIQELHQQAMDLSEAAFIVKLRGDLAPAIQLYRQALDKESQAAALIADKLDAEPTRSVLHRSAASLAIDCGEFRAAERLIAIALSGNPPQEIAEELKDLFIKINLRPYLERHGLAFDEQKLSNLTLDKKPI
jgi:tetratricopeptide (TPR) repeat protein